MFSVTRLASAVFNNVQAGLVGYTSTISLPMEQIEDAVVQEYLLLLKKYSIKNMIPRRDLFDKIDCIQIDCESMDQCCSGEHYSDPVAHFQIPPIVNDFGEQAVAFIGTIDKEIKFKVYFNSNYRFHKYQYRGKEKPYVYISPGVNENGYQDCWLFNAPMLEKVSIIALFRDPRVVEKYMKKNGCCARSEVESISWLESELVDSLTQKYLMYYRKYTQQPEPTDTVPR